MRARHRSATMLVLALALAACHPIPPAPTRQPYTGPTLSLDELIERINENNRRLPTVWARIHQFHASFTDADHKTHSADGEGGYLLFGSPASLKITVSNELAGPLFELGSDGERFWLWQKQPDSVFWWGDYAHLSDTDGGQIPIRPDLVLEVLGILPIDTNLLQTPAPVMRFNSEEDAYMLVWQIPWRDRWIAQKEVWYDRRTFHPELIRLFDAGGRVVLQATLSNFAPVEMSTTIPGSPAVMANRYELYFPDNGTKMNFDLSDVSLSYRGLPKTASFRMPDLKTLPSGIRMIPIDQDSGR